VGTSEREVDRREVVFTSLFERHHLRIRHHIECLIDETADVDDLVADVFEVAWAKLRPESPMGLAWLLRTADNKVRDRDRRRRSRDRALGALSRGAGGCTALDEQGRFEVREALESLSHRERVVVVMTYWGELSAGEVAAVLHCSQASVWTALSRARAKMRHALV
jgi:RNA polymerase sigma-70 factor (ECF subfamily)